MKSELMISATDVVFAIRGAYRSAQTCHCETVAKLGADELLEHLIGQRLLPDISVYAPNSIHIDDIPDQEWAGLRPYNLRQVGIEYLAEATQYTRQELCRYPNWGPAKVGVLERILARRGMTLRGANPGIIDRVKQEDEESRRFGKLGNDGRPGTFEEALEELIKIGRSLLDDGQLLLNAAAKLGVRAAEGRNGRRTYTTILRKYSNSVGRGRAHHVAQLLAPLGAAEEDKSRKKAGRQKRVEQLDNERPSNVVRLVAAE